MIAVSLEMSDEPFVLSFKWLWQLLALSDVREEMRK